MNNDIVSGFDDVLDKHLSIKLETLAEIRDYLIAHFNGYIDLSNHEFAHGQVKKIIDAGFFRLIIDCNALEAQSDMTTGIFLAALKNTHNRDGDLILTGVQPLFNSLLEFHGVKKYFNCKKDLAEAIEYIRNKDRTR